MTAANLFMAIAKGRSCIMVELDILKETLENMINSTESEFRDIIDSLKAELFDIEHNKSIKREVRNSLSSPFYEELDIYTSQRFISRNKLVICIYSICEATLASICKDYNYKIVKESSHNIKSMSCPNLNGRECNVKRIKRTNYYLKDYLYSLNPAYSIDWNEAHIVSTAIKDLRNYLIHSKADVKQAEEIIDRLSKCGFNCISQEDGKIIIQDVRDIQYILNICYKMLVTAEQIAKLNLISGNK